MQTQDAIGIAAAVALANLFSFSGELSNFICSEEARTHASSRPLVALVADATSESILEIGAK